MPAKSRGCNPLPEAVPFPAGDLLYWYCTHRRKLPWRETKDPYRIWISEIMLQQTQVATVIPYYKRFLERFPSVSDLAEASEQAVLKVWENLGYYTRARQLHRAAKIVVEQYGGQFPDRREDIFGLPGIGVYTAGAILSIAFGQAIPAIDGNVRRVLCRFFALNWIWPDKDGDRRLADILNPLLLPGQAGDFNQALMELGATLCRSRKPRCADCPLRVDCQARALGCPEEFPSWRPQKVSPVRHAVAALIKDDKGRILMVKRDSGRLLGGLWKFPGGFCEEGESPDDALTRTIREEIGVVLHGETYLATIRHAYTHFRLRLHVFSGMIFGRPKKRELGPDFRWTPPPAIRDLPLSKVDRQAATLGGLL